MIEGALFTGIKNRKWCTRKGVSRRSDAVGALWANEEQMDPDG
jgi:hypothetical protein